MRRTTAAMATLGLAATLGMTACGSGSGSGPHSGSDTPDAVGSTTTPGISAGCSLDNPPTSRDRAPAGGAPAFSVHGGRKVGVVLPDTTAPRYELYDKPLLTKALSAAGAIPDVQNADGDPAEFAKKVQTMIRGGVDVLILDAVDPVSGAAAERQAARAGVPVIDYDRFDPGGRAPYFVGFDHEDIGRLQAQTMLDCLDAQGVADPTVIMMDGGTDVDNDAVLLAKGAHEVLDPARAAGTIGALQEATVKGWRAELAGPAFQVALGVTSDRVDAVLAADDMIAAAVLGVLGDQGAAGGVVLTGQGSGTGALRNIVTGQQSMTIFENVKLEARAAAWLAIALLSGDPAATGLTLTPYVDPLRAKHHVQALLLPTQVITQANLDDVVRTGALTTADLCQGVTDACAALGLS